MHKSKYIENDYENIRLRLKVKFTKVYEKFIIPLTRKQSFLNFTPINQELSNGKDSKDMPLS
jgi:hypothetical protein